MRVLIVRHGEAVDDAGKLGDRSRWLTGKGRRRSREVALFIAGRSAGPTDDPVRRAIAEGQWRPAAVWTSALVRAVQTAEIVALGAGLDDSVEVEGDLAPDESPRALAKRVRAYDGSSPLAVVGHEPGLSAFAREMLGEELALPLNKSGVVALELAENRDEPATLVFHLRPKDMSLFTPKRNDASV